MKRRPKGQGCIVKMGGVHYGRIVHHGKVTMVKLSKNQRESEGLWKKWLNEHSDTFKRMPRFAALHSVDDAWAALLNAYHARNASQAAIANNFHLFSQFKEWMAERGKTSLEDITTNDIVLCLDECTKGKSTALQRNFIYVVRGLWYNSMPDEKNPAATVKAKWVPQISRETLSDEEISAVLKAARNRKDGNEFAGLISVALYTGLRRKDCVYLNASKIHDGVIETTPYKTVKKGIVVRIPLHEKLKECLNELEGCDENGYYFPHLIGLYQTGSLDEALKRVFESCFATSKTVPGRQRKVPVKSFHSLRATFITRLAEANVSLAVIKSMSGHRKMSTLMRYVHLSEESKTRAIDTLDFGLQ